MTNQTHGLSIGIERHDDDVFLNIKAIGKLTHDDYQTITPMIDAALQCVNDPKVRVLFDAMEFEGWELRAAWDDFNLGLKYSNEFEKIAVYGHSMWQELGVKIGSWFISGEVQFFEDKARAIDWLKA